MAGIAGTRIRTFRRMRQLTLRHVSDAAGITESYLSQIERGMASGSVDVLSRVAGALGLTLSDLFSDDLPAHRVLRSGERPEIVSTGVRKYLLTRRPLRSLEVMEAVLDPGATIGDSAHKHGDSQELLIVTAGEIRCTVDGIDYALTAGDSIEYSSGTPHSLANLSQSTATVLYVLSPPSI